MRCLLVLFMLAAGMLVAQTQTQTEAPPVPPPPSETPVAPSSEAPASPKTVALAVKKASGPERQRASIKRQMGGLDELGWIFRPLPNKPELTPRQE